jgi:hypothetical protein
MMLTDETYAGMREALELTLTGQEILRRFDRPIGRLPSDKDTLAIVRAARSEPDAVPELIAAAVERRDAGRATADETREAVERLLFHLSDAGVPPSVLTRWFGYSSSRLFQLLDKRATAAA